MAELFTLEYCKLVIEKTQQLQTKILTEMSTNNTPKHVDVPKGIEYVITNNAYHVPSSVVQSDIPDDIPDDIPRLSDPFRDPKLSWMRSK